MADNLGRLAIPASGTDPVIGDPALYYLGNFLGDVINDHLSEAWLAAFAPNAVGAVADRIKPIKKVIVDDPSQGEFNEADLPALFLFRSSWDSEIQGEEWIVRRTQLRAQWVFPTAPQAPQALRSNFGNALSASLHRAVELGRHPSHIVAGDTDPRAPTEGTFIYAPAYVNPVSLVFNGARPMLLALAMDRGPKRAYPAIDMTLSLSELWEEGLTGFAPNTSLDVSVKNEQGDEIVAARLT